MKNQEKSDLSIFFISEEYKYIFALCYTDKKLRADLLGITEELYEDNEKAKIGVENRIVFPSCRLAFKKIVNDRFQTFPGVLIFFGFHIVHRSPELPGKLPGISGDLRLRHLQGGIFHQMNRT